MRRLQKLLPLLGAIVCLLLLGPGLALTFRGITDFIDLYAGAKLTFTGDQYNVARVLATEAHFTGYSSPTRLFMRLPVFGLLLWPLAQVPYLSASAIWESLCALAIASFPWIWPGRKRIWTITACCWSLPVWMTLAEGQDVAFLLLWLALAILALRKQRPILSGLLLSLCAAKFHLFLLLPIWLVLNRLWRVGAGVAIGGALLITASFLAGGVAWPQHYFDLLREPANNPYPDLMPNVHSLFGGIAIALVAILAMRKLNAPSGLAVVLIGGILIAPHDYMADCALILPAALLLLERNQPALTRGLLLLLLTPVPYVALMLHASSVLTVPMIAAITILAFFRPYEESTQPQFEQCPSAGAHSPAL